MNNSAIFGIDLGTTNSAISIVAKGNLSKVIPLHNRDLKLGEDILMNTMPSCVMWTGGDKFVVGKLAYNNRDKENVCYSIKRLMTKVDATYTFRYNGEERTMTAVEISAEILKGLVAKTEGEYGEVKDVIITVPAYFGRIGVGNTEKAAELAGLNLIQVINEPTAAAIVYDAVDNDSEKDVLVYDLGGGTFDVTLARITPSRNEELADFYKFDDSDDNFPKNAVKVLASQGDPVLGGDDIDKDMLNIVMEKMQKSGVDTSLIPDRYKERMILELEGLKKDNSSADEYSQYNFGINYRDTNGKEVHMTVPLTQHDFMQSVANTMARTFALVDQVLTDVSHHCSTIVLVGGSTINPHIRNAIRARYGAKYRINDSMNPDLSVSNGAAVYGKSVRFGDAAVQVFDIVNIPIGVASMGEFERVIDAGATLPAEGTITMSTVKDNQTELHINLYQGTSRYVDDCTSLGTIHIKDIPPAPADDPCIVVTIKVSVANKLICTASIDGKVQTLELDLRGRSDSASSKEEKKCGVPPFVVKRWRRFAETLCKEDNPAGEQLKSLLDRLDKGEDLADQITSLISSLE